MVATPIGNLADISQRALDVLQQVDLIAAEDTRHSGRLLSHFGIDKPLLSLHEHNEKARSEAVIEKLQAGNDIALVSDAGTPLISDPGYPLVNSCRQQHIPVVPVPGPSALITALSVSGLPTDSFHFCGFPPRHSAKRQEYFRRYLKETATLVFYESSHRIQASLEDAVIVFGPDRMACLARELTKLYETVITAPLGELQQKLAEDENQSKGEFVLMIQGLDHADTEHASEIDSDTLLKTLLEELPVKKAAALTARLTGKKKNELYKKALDLKKD